MLEHEVRLLAGAGTDGEDFFAALSQAVTGGTGWSGHGGVLDLLPGGALCCAVGSARSYVLPSQAADVWTLLRSERKHAAPIGGWC